MKVSLLHGGNLQAELQKLDELVAQFGPPAGGGVVVRASGKEITPEFILNHFGAAELFGEKKLIVLTNPDDNFEVDKLPENEGVELVMLYDKELGVRAKVMKEKRVVGGKVYNFVSPQDRRIWTLLDMILENDPRGIKLTMDLLDEFGGQYLLAMMIFNLRRLVVPGNAPEFVRKKLVEKRQAWGISGIKDRYHDCLETDLKIKTGMGLDKDLVSLMVINWMN